MKSIAKALKYGSLFGLLICWGCSQPARNPNGQTSNTRVTASNNNDDASKLKLSQSKSESDSGEPISIPPKSTAQSQEDLKGVVSKQPGNRMKGDNNLLEELSKEAESESPLGPPEKKSPNIPVPSDAQSIPEEPKPLPPLEPIPREFPFEIPAEWKRLAEAEEIWIDPVEHRVIVSGRICLRQGMLEMFACPRATKEHEAIVATYPISSYIHQALLLVGSEPGSPVQWEPEYKAATGPKVNIECWFYDEEKKLQKVRAQEMVRKVADKSKMENDWVFGGSRFAKDYEGREFYAANGGEMICLSNFSSAMIDLPISSTDQEGDLLFEANPEKIPPLDTPVLLVLKPELSTKPENQAPNN